MFEMLSGYCRPLGIELTHGQLEQLEHFARLLAEGQQRLNLMGKISSEELLIKHFFDSLTPLSIVKPQPEELIIDVGTGAGFPGIPLAIAVPHAQVTLLDSLQKRMGFLAEVKAALGLRVDLVTARAEEAARGPLRERAKLVVARAVASLPVLAEYCLPFVAVGGFFLAMKGPKAEQECQEAQTAITQLGGEIDQVKKIMLPAAMGERQLVLIRKTKATPDRFPRRNGVPAKKPLL